MRRANTGVLVAQYALRESSMSSDGGGVDGDSTNGDEDDPELDEPRICETNVTLCCNVDAAGAHTGCSLKISAEPNEKVLNVKTEIVGIT